jgi:hypothetical protein
MTDMDATGTRVLTAFALAVIAVSVGILANSFWWMLGAYVYLGFLWAACEEEPNV